MIALKSTAEEEEESNQTKNDDEDEELALITQNSKDLWRKEDNG